MHTTLPLALSAALLLSTGSAAAQRDCSRTSTGAIPIVDLGTGRYLGRDGGLYGGGQNTPPAGHATAGARIATGIVPRDASGQPAAAGTICLLSIGMSNWTREFSTWMGFSALDPRRSAAVTVVDGAQGGVDARRFADPDDPAWTEVMRRLARAGVTPLQVQSVFVKEAMANPSTLAFPAHAVELTDALAAIAQNLRQKFPHAAQCFVTSRIYGGYSTRPERSEPLSYETGFAVRDLVLRQINGDPALNFDPARGPVRAPWLAWGPYLWADGVLPRSDGLVWICDDYDEDGVHPAPAGRLKVADLIDPHFGGDPFASAWYLGPPRTATAGVLAYGDACAGAVGPAAVRANGRPVLGNASYAFGVTRMPAAAAAAALIAGERWRVLLAPRCNLWLDPGTLLLALPHTVQATGNAVQPLPVPAQLALAGLRLHTQWAAVDPGGTAIPGLGGVALSPGQLHQLGLQ